MKIYRNDDPYRHTTQPMCYMQMACICMQNFAVVRCAVSEEIASRRGSQCWNYYKMPHFLFLLVSSLLSYSEVSKISAIAVRNMPRCYRNSRHMGSHSVTCHLAKVTFLPLPQPIKAGTELSNAGEMQAWVDLVGLVTYRGGIPARRQSPIPVITGLNIVYVHLQQCGSSAKYCGDYVCVSVCLLT